METELVTPEKLDYLERQLHNLSKLVEINSIINSTLDIGKLLYIIMEIIKEIMETEASTLLLYEEETHDLVFKVALGEAGKELQEKYRVKIGQGIAGWVAEHRKVVYINDVYSDPRFDPNFDKKTGFVTKSILCAPLLFKGKLLGVIQAINPTNKSGFDDDDVVLFNAFANQAALAVQNAIFFQNAIEEERIKNELAAAHSIHHSLLPKIRVEEKEYSLSARSVSAREVGGEFYDIYFFDNRLAITLGDIHTKGIPGALQASIINGAVKSLATIGGLTPEFVHSRINALIKNRIGAIRQVSLFYGLFTLNEKSISFVNSGIAYPILVRDGVARYIKIGGKSLDGSKRDFKKVKINFKKGDALVIVTDGLVARKNRNGIQLGLKRVMDFLSKTTGTATTIVDALFSFADEFTEGVEVKEDISVIALKIHSD
ncbi:MAG: SpoIIE family protein phosphatase [Spirochaetes bacterium]|nr:SpoIIE family protein phosphatase [Spirochaetota bacterium]